MSEAERVGAGLIFLIIVGLGGLFYMSITQNERMAEKGYIVYRLAGSADIFWTPLEPPVAHEKMGTQLQGPRGF